MKPAPVCPTCTDRTPRPLSTHCATGNPEHCTGIANPDAPVRERRGCHGATHVATF